MYYLTLSLIIIPLHISPSVTHAPLPTLLPHHHAHTRNSWLTFLPSHSKGISQVSWTWEIDLDAIPLSSPSHCPEDSGNQGHVHWVDLGQMNVEPTEVSTRNLFEWSPYNLVISITSSDYKNNVPTIYCFPKIIMSGKKQLKITLYHSARCQGRHKGQRGEVL